MFNADLMQFKDEMLKYLREMEKKIMLKVNKNQTEISSDLNIINDSIKLLKDNNNSLIESMTEQKLNLDKFSNIENCLKKLNTTITTHENKISDSISEISYIRNKCEKSISDTFSVPGVIGKNCKYSNFNEYIMNNMKELANLKSEKDFNKKENKELRQKLDHGLKNLSNLVDNFINRSKSYTDNTKKNIIELMENKINEINDKNMELMTKMCKIEIDTEEKIKKFEENMEEFNKKKTDQFQKMEDKLLVINYNIEEMSKNFTLTKEEINSIKINEEKYRNDINELRRIFKDIFNNNKNNNNMNNINNQQYKNTNNNNIDNNNNKKYFPVSSKTNFFSIDKNEDLNNNNNEQNKINLNNETNIRKIKVSKTSRNSLALSDSNFNANNNMNMNNKIINQINNNSTYNNFYISSKKNNNKNTIELDNQEEIGEENKYLSDEMSQTDDDEEIKNKINKNIELLSEPNNNIYNNYTKNFNILSNRENNITSKNIFNKSNNYMTFDNNIISAEKNTKKSNVFNLHNIHPNNKNSVDSNLLNQNKLNEAKEQKINNHERIILNHLINKKTNIISLNMNKIKHKNFPAIKNTKLTFSYGNIKKNIFNNDELLILENSNRNKTKNLNDYYKYINKNKQMGIDKETGIGCKIVKLSFDDNTMTPYNTNGLLTIASKKYLNKHLIRVDESTPFDDIYLNMYHTFRTSNSLPKKKMNYNKTTEIFYNNDIDKIYKNNNKENRASKTINQNDAYHNGKVKFHLIKK